VLFALEVYIRKKEIENWDKDTEMAAECEE